MSSVLSFCTVDAPLIRAAFRCHCIGRCCYEQSTSFREETILVFGCQNSCSAGLVSHVFSDFVLQASKLNFSSLRE